MSTNSLLVLKPFISNLSLVPLWLGFPLDCSLSGVPHCTLLEKAKLAREISDGKNEIPHKFLGRKI